MAFTSREVPPVIQSIRFALPAGGVENMSKQNEAAEFRDPEDRTINEGDLRERKDKMMDKTIADTFPASDPPSTLPDPDEDSFAA